MRRGMMALVAAIAILAVIVTADRPRTTPVTAHGPAFEVWSIDQSDTTADGGGTLYIYRGEQLSSKRAASARPETIDLGGAARDACLAQTGSAPRRPHMFFFAGGDRYVVLSFVASGHVVLMDAIRRAPLACVDAGEQAHAALPSPDGRYVVVANQNGRLLQRITTDYTAGSFVLDSAATLDLAACRTPSGAACQDAGTRPDNAPVCPVISADSRLTFVTLRGGGMFVVDGTATPMRIVAEYDRTAVHPNGCGGVEAAGKMYINAGGGTAANPLESDLYAFPLAGYRTPSTIPNTPAPKLVFSHDHRYFVDSHGAALTRGGRYLWVADRAANRIVVVDVHTDVVVHEIELYGDVSPDPAPDLIDLSPDGGWAFVSLRGPNPLTGSVAGINNAAGQTPGVGVIRLRQGGRTGGLLAIAPITHLVDGVERADPHAIGVRHRKN